ncbi:helicase C-terminal domain-containing protein [Tenacibaculum sp. MAR_2009_124]|uniref:helicase C-terminal domain-containing protein n=1 Tax=Tenacibaculum sp. MAR_2009_124 TaxID=1250059 RepID=UPI000B834AE7
MSSIFNSTPSHEVFSIDVRLLNQDLIENENNKLSIISEHVANTYYETNEFKGVQAIFSDIGTPKDSFNVYDHIKNTLIDKHKINPNEIIFIHDFKNDLQREQCFKDLNAGIYRIVIGSTDKLGTGTNFQNRLIHIHHVDIPFDPSKIDQRNGRGARPDNVFCQISL